MGLLQRGSNAHLRLTTRDKCLCGNTYRVTRLELLDDRWRKRQHSNMLLKNERDSLVEMGCGIALCNRLHEVDSLRANGR
jgi:hypothetical protein